MDIGAPSSVRFHNIIHLATVKHSNEGSDVNDNFSSFGPVEILGSIVVGNEEYR